MEYRVSGKVISPTRPGIGDLRVVIVDKNIGKDVILAETSTDAEGRYEAVFTFTGRKQQPDLQARAFHGETFLGASAVRYNASIDETLNVAISGALPSEYEALIADLAKQFDGPLKDLQESGDRQDITYLANKTGWDARAVALAALADQFSANTVAGDGRPAIASAFFYALLRSRASTNEPALYQTKLQTVEAIWKGAIEQGLIPPALEHSLPQALEQFKRLAVSHILEAPARSRDLSINTTMDLPFGDDPQRQRAFVELYVEHGTDLAGFWKAVESAFPADVEQLKFDGRLGHLTRFNAPLVRRLNASNNGFNAANNARLTSGRNVGNNRLNGSDNLDPALQLVEAGFFRAETWQQVLDDQAIPPEIPGNDTQEKRARYAELLAAQVRLSSPTAVVAQMIKSRETPLTGAQSAAPQPNAAAQPALAEAAPSPAEAKLPDQVHALLVEQAGTFDIGAQPIEQYLAQHNLQWPSKVTQEVKRIQRVYQIAPSDEAMNALLREGVDSAAAVLNYDRDRFIETFKDQVGGEADAALIYAKSQQIHNAVLNIATSYLVGRTAPAIGLASEENRAKYLDPAPMAAAQEVAMASGVIAYPTLEGLFGEMDYCACEHCRSILSPAAYLVDLLQFLDPDDKTWSDFIAKWRTEHGAPYPYANQAVWEGAGRPQGTEIKPYEVLRQRRPDIEHLQLTCANTNTSMPYIDLVNELLGYLVRNDSLKQYKGHNTDEFSTSEELLASPQAEPRINKHEYITLASVLFPLTLPFSWRVEFARRLFDRFQSSVLEAMEVMRKHDHFERTIGPPDENGDEIFDSQGYGWRDILMEALQLRLTEYKIFTDLGVPLQELYGYPVPDEEAELPPEISRAKIFSRRLGISYENLIEILKTRFINPNSALIPKLERLGVSFQRLKELKEHSSTGQAWLDLLPRPLPDAAHYGGNIETWVKNEANFADIMSLITLTNPADADDLCSFDKLEFRYANPNSDTNKLRPTDFLRLLRFIRLWKKLGWTIEQTDKAMSALYPASGVAIDIHGGVDLEKPDAGFVILLARLAMLKRLMDTLGLEPDRDLLPLLACFAPIDTHGPTSLYRQMFLSPVFLERYPVFADNGFGQFPSRPEPLANYADALRAAFLLTADELGQIRAALGFDANTPLTVDNMSAVFRRGWLARQLRLSVRELLLLIKCTGLDPFAMLDPPDASAQPPRGHPPIMRFIDMLSRLRNTALKPEQALYLLWNEDLSGKSAPGDREILDFARTLRAGMAAIESEFAVAEDPDGQIARARMALVYGDETTGAFFGLLEHRTVTDIKYRHHQATLEPEFVQVGSGRIVYDNQRERLSYTHGAMSTELREALLFTSSEVHLDAHEEFRQAVADLHAKTRTLFDRYPELLPLHDAYVASNDPAEKKRSDLLAGFLPELKRRRKRQQVLQAIGGTTRVDLGLAVALLDNRIDGRYVLHAADDSARPALDDLMALEQTPGFPEDFIIFAMEPSLGVWSGYLEAPEDGRFHFRVQVEAQATAKLILDGVSLELERDGAAWATKNPVELRGGALYALLFEVKGSQGKLEVAWLTTGRGWELIPPRLLYSFEVNKRLRTTYTRFLKAVALASGLKLTANEIVHFAAPEALQIGNQGWLNSLDVDRKPGATTSAQLFKALSALLDFAGLKASLAPGDERLLAVLRDPAAATENTGSLLYTLTGWEKDSLEAMLAHFGKARTDLAQLETFRRVYDGFALLKKLRISVPALLSGANNSLLGIGSAFLSALRARHNAGDWLKVLKSINDEMRVLERDALVAYILHEMRSDPKTEHIDTPDKLFEHFLMDVQMDSCMQTSRVRHALSSVQLFIHRCLMNLEPQVALPEAKAKQWEWMKRYRVWEANRKVFLYPENWLEPELRDDASPIFKETMSELLQGDITDDRAATALVNYLSKLEEIAKLEPCGIYYAENDIGKAADDVAHVVARTVGANRKYYYRRREGGSWTPWEQIKLDIEGDHVQPMIWKGRLLLLWLRIVMEPEPQPLVSGQLTSISTKQIQPKLKVHPKLILYWSEYYNGKWQAPKTSDVADPLVAHTEGDPGELILPPGVDIPLEMYPYGMLTKIEFAAEAFDDRLQVPVKTSLGGSGGFILYNTHSLPEQHDTQGLQLQDGVFQPPLVRWPEIAQVVGADRTLMIFTEPGGIHWVLQSKHRGRTLQPQHPLGDWVHAPFFYANAEHVFYVTPTVREPSLPDPISLLIDPSIPDPCEQFPELCFAPNITRELGIKGPVRFGDTLIGPGGALGDGAGTLERARREPVDAQPRARFHGRRDRGLALSEAPEPGTKFIYTFEHFFHPFVGELIQKLNRESLRGLLDPNYHERLAGDASVTGPDSLFKHFDYTRPPDLTVPTGGGVVRAESYAPSIDVEVGRPYSNYNWELFFHIPLAIAVHLSKNQRFAEAQRWFHFIFDPTSNEATPPPRRFWRFLAFRKPDQAKPIDALLALLSKPNPTPQESQLREQILAGYEALKNNPFQPHVVARTRQVAYQYNVVMKYLDNLIAWGDSLFQQDTIETINEATQIYVLAANILGPRPQRIPPAGNVRPQTYALIKQRAHDALGNLLVELEGQFPFNLGLPRTQTDNSEAASQLFGIGRALYFCIPPNDKLLGYWDTVADRLFKIRHCMNIEGLVRQLELFDPLLDPGMLVKAAAAGIDIGAAVSGLQQPLGLVRAPYLIQKALELCGEVRGLGAALLAAIEKGDGERIALLRQGHEIKIQHMQKEVRLLQWKQAQEATESLLRSRGSALERYRYYLRLLGQAPDTSAPDTLPLDRRELTAENFEQVHAALVGQYAGTVSAPEYPWLKLAAGAAPGNQSGRGNLYLTSSEDAELNRHLPTARDRRVQASILHTIATVLTFIPDFNLKIAPFGIGADSEVFGGAKLSDALKIAAEIISTEATWEQDQAGIASRTASYERRAEDWILQARLAARELAQIGRQIIGALIAEQIARREYLNIQKQIEQTQEVDRFLREKFTNEELYAWMQGEVSRLYYEYYRFAFDTARKAEQTMKRELMRPEVDATDYIKVNYWDGGRKGLLSGEALYLDLKRMELAYHDNNRRELELTRHVSLRQLDPLELLTLKATGSCEVTIPEWLYDLGCPGHYMRRIKSVALSIPAVAGPYTSVNCTLALQKSRLRTSPELKGDRYERQVPEDDRFKEYVGAVQSIVTSGGQHDSGMFEVNLRDERFLPFEGAGAECTWTLTLPKDYRAFDYGTISDVVLHIRYTARQGVNPTKVKEALDALFLQADQANLALLFSLRHDFPTQWAAFASGAGDFKATIGRNHFPYFTQGKRITIAGFDLYKPDGANPPAHTVLGDQPVWDAATADLNDSTLNDSTKQAFTVTADGDALGPPPAAAAQVFLIVRYSLRETV